MAAPKTKTRTEREEHLGKVADLYCRGWRQCDIAQELGVDQSQISYDLRILRGRWERASTHKIDRFKAQELAKINTLEREYWQAWERSCEDAETIRKKKSKVGDGKEHKEMVTTARGQAGDPRFLQGVQWCIERRCKILGIDAPTKHDLTTKGERLGSISHDDRMAATFALIEHSEARAVSADVGSAGAVDPPDEGAG